MVQGYVELYTNVQDFEQYLLTGSCMATINKSELEKYKIIVPREYVQTTLMDTHQGYGMKPEVMIDLNIKVE
jgi:hypothetical protein